MVLTAVISSCAKDNPGAWVDNNPNYNPSQPSSGQESGQQAHSYNEPCRPQIHFTPAANWMNDPNGMVYLDGVWHLFYQYNPYGNDWGNMSWGHATSTDLIHWSEQAVALTRSAQGDIFSGSCVVDAGNTAGFGKNAIVAVYTANGERQQQNIAYSTDGGKNFTQYEGNPVISNTTRADFRDPKVFWDSEKAQWVMSLALGWEKKIEFWASKDLKSWNRLSDFAVPDKAACNLGQWECPDLLKMPLEGQERWVLIVSVNPGGPNGGSGTMYFVGDWDGTAFTAMDQEYPLWLDSGADNYAGVTFSNTPDGSCKLIGWMNNWNYAGASPVSPWRSAMTLPRELSLKQIGSQVLLCSRVVSAIDTIAGEWQSIGPGDFSSALGGEPCSQLHVEIPVLGNGTIVLGNSAGESYEISVNKAAGLLITARGAKTGKVSFNGTFSLPSVKSALQAEEALSLDIFIDQSSVEIFSSDGSLVQTNTVYPAKAYHTVTLSGLDATVRVRPLRRIWQ